MFLHVCRVCLLGVFFFFFFFFLRFRGLLFVLFLFVCVSGDCCLFWFTLIYFARIYCTDDIVTLVTEIFAICILFMNIYWDCLLFEM